MGKLYVIGIGPGGLTHMTIRAMEAIKESDIVVGYNKYIDMIKPLLDGKGNIFYRYEGRRRAMPKGTRALP